MWFDTHCHLDFECFQSEWQEYKKRFHEAEVFRFLVPAVGQNNWKPVLELSGEEGICVAIGIHPLRVKEQYQLPTVLQDELIALEEYFAEHESKITAVGECGLDKRFKESIDQQLEVFDFQLELAKQYNKPVVIHSVKQHHLVQERLKQAKVDRGIVHGFSGNYQQAKALVDTGMKLGIGGVITRPTAEPTRDAIAKLPLDSIVLETDAPDMPLYGMISEINSPQYIPHIFKYLVKIRNENASILAEAIWRNSNQVFAIN